MGKGTPVRPCSHSKGMIFKSFRGRGSGRGIGWFFRRKTLDPSREHPRFINMRVPKMAPEYSAGAARPGWVGPGAQG
jgi:hypothetical protein